MVVPLEARGRVLGRHRLIAPGRRPTLRPRRPEPGRRPRRPGRDRHRQRQALPRRPGGRPPEERVPGDARPRAPQPAGPDPQRRRDPPQLGIHDDDLGWASDVIARQVEQMVRLVDDLLDISRITGGKIQLRKEPVDVGAVVARAVETSRPLIEAREPRRSPSSCPREPVLGRGRPGPALPGPGEPAEQRRQVHRGRRPDRPRRDREGDEAVFRVRDNGIGIPAEMLAQVFDLFTQVDRSLDRSQGGLGIGLTLVRRLVEMHGGTVQARSEGPGRGSEFILRLPALADRRRAAIGRRPAASNEADRETAAVGDLAAASWSSTTTPTPPGASARLLRLSGHEVSTAHDGPTPSSSTRRSPGLRPPRHRPARDGRLRGGPSIRRRPDSGGRPGRPHRLRPGGGSPAVPRGGLRPPPRQARGARDPAGDPPVHPIRPRADRPSGCRNGGECRPSHSRRVRLRHQDGHGVLRDAQRYC